MFLQCNHWLSDNNSSKRSAGYYTMKTNILKRTGCIWFRWQVIKHCNSFWGKNHFTKKNRTYKIEIIVSECHPNQWAWHIQSNSFLLGTIPDFQKIKPASKWIFHNWNFSTTCMTLATQCVKSFYFGSWSDLF